MAFVEIYVGSSAGDPNHRLRLRHSVDGQPVSGSGVDGFTSSVVPGDQVVWVPEGNIDKIIGITPTAINHYNIFRQGPAPYIHWQTLNGGKYPEGTWWGVVGNEFQTMTEPYTIAYTVDGGNNVVYSEDPKMQLHPPSASGGGN